jgi:hypothetical protein
MLFKNVASQKAVVFAYDKTTGVAQTGDAANITASVSKDGGAPSASNDTNPTEIGGGWYAFDLTQAETNCDLFLLYAASSTGSILVTGVSGYTTGGAIPQAGVAAAATALSTATWTGTRAGYLDSLNGHIAQTGDTYARLGAPAGASVSADVAAVKTETASIQSDTNDIQTRLPAALVGGRMASNAEVVGDKTGYTVSTVSDKTGYSLSGTQTFNVTGNITGNLSGSVGSVTGAVGSVTGNVGGNVAGSVASVTAAVSLAADSVNSTSLAASAVAEIQSGLSTLDAAGVRSAVGLASANLDTQLTAINGKTTNLPSDPADASDIAAAFSSLNTKVDTIDDLLGTEVPAIKAKTDLIPASPAAVSDIPTAVHVAAATLARAIDAETYATDGGTPTLSQILWMLWSGLVDYSITGTTLTVKKQDGTAAMTFTLDSASAPTSRTRAT